MSVHFLVTTGTDRDPGTVSTNIPANVNIFIIAVVDSLDIHLFFPVDLLSASLS